MSAFVTTYPEVVRALVSEVGIITGWAGNKAKYVPCKALWDTGAVYSVISSNLATKLGLVEFDRGRAYTAQGSYETSVLKVDFPRIPYPENGEAFRKRAAIGQELVAVHLLKDAATGNMFDPHAQFPVAGTGRVDALKFADGKVWINREQYFDNVPEAAWNVFIGGYQPAQKWLKDRKGRTLTSDDILHYKKIVIALLETARLMAELDEIAPNG